MTKEVDLSQQVSLKKELVRLLEPAIEAEGFELVAMELSGQPGRSILRLFLDSPKGVTVDDCAHISRTLSVLLDVEDPIMGRYVLEVSSPGINRPLAKPAHFKAHIGQTIRVKAYKSMSGNQKNFKGILHEFQPKPDRIMLKLENGFITLKLDNIQKANLEADIDFDNHVKKAQKNKGKKNPHPKAKDKPYSPKRKKGKKHRRK